MTLPFPFLSLSSNLSYLYSPINSSHCSWLALSQVLMLAHMWLNSILHTRYINPFPLILPLSLLLPLIEYSSSPLFLPFPPTPSPAHLLPFLFISLALLPCSSPLFPPLGSANHLSPADGSPDDNANKEIGDQLSEFAGPFKSNVRYSGTLLTVFFSGF